MKYNYIQAAVDVLTNIDDFDPREFRGCSHDEVRKLEELIFKDDKHYWDTVNSAESYPELKKYVKFLSDAYDEFLYFGGNGICGMLQGSNFYYNSVYFMQQTNLFQELKDQGNFFAENFDFSTIKDQMIIFCHQGYFIRSIDISDSYNPAVFYYQAGMQYDRLSYQKIDFSEFLLEESLRYKELYQQTVLQADKGLQQRVKSYKTKVFDMIDLLEPVVKANNTEGNRFLLDTYYDIDYRMPDLFTYSGTPHNKYKHLANFSHKFIEYNSGLENQREIVHLMDETAEQGEELLAYIECLYE
jgi:hypothetical protein